MGSIQTTLHLFLYALIWYWNCGPSGVCQTGTLMIQRSRYRSIFSYSQVDMYTRGSYECINENHGGFYSCSDLSDRSAWNSAYILNHAVRIFNTSIYHAIVVVIY